MSATVVGVKENVLNSRRSSMAKTVTFWPWWQPFNSFWAPSPPGDVGSDPSFISFLFVHLTLWTKTQSKLFKQTSSWKYS